MSSMPPPSPDHAPASTPTPPPPSLPDPGLRPPAPTLPDPGNRPPAPTLPDPVDVASAPIPTLPDPVLSATPSASTASTTLTPLPPPGPGATTKLVEQHLATSTSDASTPARGRGPLVLLALLAIAAGLTAWWFLGRSSPADDGRPAGPDDVAPAVADDAVADASPAPVADGDDGTVGRIAVDAIDDAGGIVDSLNADRGEAELLAELGLDALGNPVDPATTGATGGDSDTGADSDDGAVATADRGDVSVEAGTPVGHAFMWTFPSGVVASVVSDTVSGDHSYDDSNGVGFRKVGELAFARAGADSPWTMIDDDRVDGLRPLGVERPLVVADLVGEPADTFAVSSGDGTLWTIDDVAFAAADPAARADWIERVGLDASITAPVTIWVSVGRDGETISTATVERETSGELARYELTAQFDTSPGIDAPEL